MTGHGNYYGVDGESAVPCVLCDEQSPLSRSTTATWRPSMSAEQVLVGPESARWASDAVSKWGRDLIRDGMSHFGIKQGYTHR